MRRSIFLLVFGLMLGACGGGSTPGVSEQVGEALSEEAADQTATTEAADEAVDPVADTTTTVASTTTVETTTTTTTTVAETTTTEAAEPELVRSADFCTSFGAIKDLSVNFPVDGNNPAQIEPFTLEQTALYEAIEPPAAIAADFDTLRQTYIAFNAALGAAGWDFSVAGAPNPTAPEYFGTDAVRASGAVVNEYFSNSC